MFGWLKKLIYGEAAITAPATAEVAAAEVAPKIEKKEPSPRKKKEAGTKAPAKPAKKAPAKKKK